MGAAAPIVAVEVEAPPSVELDTPSDVDTSLALPSLVTISSISTSLVSGSTIFGFLGRRLYCLYKFHMSKKSFLPFKNTQSKYK